MWILKKKYYYFCIKGKIYDNLPAREVHNIPVAFSDSVL